MPKDRHARDVARLPNPSRFLLADESAADYDRLLELYVEDMKPAGARGSRLATSGRRSPAGMRPSRNF